MPPWPVIVPSRTVPQNSATRPGIGVPSCSSTTFMFTAGTVAAITGTTARESNVGNEANTAKKRGRRFFTVRYDAL